MKIFSAPPPAPDLGRDKNAPDEASPKSPAQPIPGDRGIPSINRARSLQSRVGNVLAVGLLGALSAGLLSWYYAKTFTRPARTQHAPQAASGNRAQGETVLPPLGLVRSPRASGAHAPEATSQGPEDSTSAAPEPSTVERLLGPSPDFPRPGPTPAVLSTDGAPQGAPAKSPGELAFERRLAGPAFARSARDDAPSPAISSPPSTSLPAWLGASPSSATTLEPLDKQPFERLLQPTVTAAVAASVLPTRRFLLAKGAFIDCTLETAIDSTLPGMTTCITATDTFSADGTVVLLERGTKLIGETRGQVQPGSARIFVLWTEARTPTGVIVPLSSPGTDELGRSGLPGEVNRHFWDRFGAAILLTVVTGAVQGAVNSQNSSGSVVVSPSTSTDVMTEVLKSTVNIAPTVSKRQGDRIHVLVARDVDFRSVYTLRAARPAPAPEGNP